MNKKYGLSKMRAMLLELLLTVDKLCHLAISRLLRSTPPTSSRWESEVESLPMWEAWQRKLECTETGEDKPTSTKAKTKSTRRFHKTTTPASSTKKSATTSKS